MNYFANASVIAEETRAIATSDPVFVLCMGRSGSTLLRFLLDGHPDLACPPETNLPALCGQLAVVWSLIEGAPLSPNRGDTPPEIPDGAIAGMRHMIDMMTESYLARRGKSRFCDKSLSSARFADLLLRLYPQAKFICLYRHPMDMIRSGIEACPWGLTGYGFDQYVAGSPGNVVLALARYWLDNATAIAAAEERHPDRCHRVRYEDMVTDPEKIADGIYRFLDIPPAPGIAAECFSSEHERFGPADHKIWATSRITADSVGKGESIPAGLIPPPFSTAINELALKLGYRPIDDEWGTPGQPADPRLPETVATAATGSDPDRITRYGIYGDSQVRRLDEQVKQAIGFTLPLSDPALIGNFLLVSRDSMGNEESWLVNPGARSVTQFDDANVGSDEDEDEDEDEVVWNVLGAPETWESVISGRLNLQTALRRYDLRYCSNDGEEPFITDTRLSLLASLLGLNARQSINRPEAGVTK
jgi:protein-tyrosine sulfotransferase